MILLNLDGKYIVLACEEDFMGDVNTVKKGEQVSFFWNQVLRFGEFIMQSDDKKEIKNTMISLINGKQDEKDHSSKTEKAKEKKTAAAESTKKRKSDGETPKAKENKDLVRRKNGSESGKSPNNVESSNDDSFDEDQYLSKLKEEEEKKKKDRKKKAQARLNSRKSRLNGKKNKNNKSEDEDDSDDSEMGESTSKDDSRELSVGDDISDAEELSRQQKRDGKDKKKKKAEAQLSEEKSKSDDENSKNNKQGEEHDNDDSGMGESSSKDDSRELSVGDDISDAEELSRQQKRNGKDKKKKTAEAQLSEGKSKSDDENNKQGDNHDDTDSEKGESSKKDSKNHSDESLNENELEEIEKQKRDAKKKKAQKRKASEMAKKVSKAKKPKMVGAKDKNNEDGRFYGKNYKENMLPLKNGIYYLEESKDKQLASKKGTLCAVTLLKAVFVKDYLIFCTVTGKLGNNRKNDGLTKKNVLALDRRGLDAICEYVLEEQKNKNRPRWPPVKRDELEKTIGQALSDLRAKYCTRLKNLKFWNRATADSSDDDEEIDLEHSDGDNDGED